MKKRNGIILLIVLLVVGFAAVSTTLVINGTISFGTNGDEFEVIFTKAIVDDVDLSDTVISEDGQTITYETKELAIIGEESKLDFTVKNNSTQYDAEIEINCIGGESVGTYYEITKELPTEVAAQAEVEGNVIVKMIMSSVEELTEELTCTIDVTAVEKSEAAEVVPDEPETVITYSDEDTSGTRTIGDIVTISKEGASSESFYIISSDETNTTMMSMYNLYVGADYDHNASTTTPYENPTGIQDSTMIGYISPGTFFKGVTAYSSTGTDYAGSIVEGYVNNYSTYLANTLKVENSATIITIDELNDIGCNSAGQTCTGAPAWTYSTSYWTRSVYDATYLWTVYSDGEVWEAEYTKDFNFGVRPIVTISSSLIVAS